MPEAMGGHLLGQALKPWQGVASADVTWPQSSHGCFSPSTQEEHSHLFKYIYIYFFYFLGLFPLVPSSEHHPTSLHFHGLHSFFQQLQGQWLHCLGQDSCGPRGKAVLARPGRRKGWPLNLGPSCGPSVSCTPCLPCYCPILPSGPPSPMLSPF